MSREASRRVNYGNRASISRRGVRNWTLHGTVIKAYPDDALLRDVTIPRHLRATYTPEMNPAWLSPGQLRNLALVSNARKFHHLWL